MRKSIYINLATIFAVPYTALCMFGVFAMLYYEHSYGFIPLLLGVCCFWALLFISLKGRNIFELKYWLVQFGMIQAVIYLIASKYDWDYSWTDILFVLGTLVPVVGIELHQKENLVNQSLQLKAKKQHLN